MDHLQPAIPGISLIRPEVKEYATEDVAQCHLDDMWHFAQAAEQEAIEVVDSVISKLLLS